MQLNKKKKTRAPHLKEVKNESFLSCNTWTQVGRGKQVAAHYKPFVSTHLNPRHRKSTPQVKCVG